MYVKRKNLKKKALNVRGNAVTLIHPTQYTLIPLDMQPECKAGYPRQGTAEEVSMRCAHCGGLGEGGVL